MADGIYYDVVKFIYDLATKNIVIVIFILALCQYTAQPKIKRNVGEFAFSIMGSVINTVAMMSALKLLVYSLSNNPEAEFPLSEIKIYLIGVSAIIIVTIFYGIYQSKIPSAA
ncbi:TPA: hypothetical protein QHS04_000960 [Morganella morganii subsp. morganii]|nr:hypothetical protein [Morganella morganii subsp. morganii]